MSWIYTSLPRPGWILYTPKRSKPRDHEGTLCGGVIVGVALERKGIADFKCKGSENGKANCGPSLAKIQRSTTQDNANAKKGHRAEEPLEKNNRK